MKLISRVCMVFTFALLLLCLSGKAEAATLNTRALWISSVYNLDYPSRSGLSAAQLQAEADSIIEYAKDTYITDLFLQVRPCGDALYHSRIFPWSVYLSGKAGTAPDQSFDPLAYFIEAGHAAGIRIHAWINPYILTRQAADCREEAFSLLAENHPARDIPDAVVYHTNGRLYLDLGHPDARSLILAGITEILDNYAVDGIHFDDYFYPGTDFADGNTYAAFGEGLALDDFRRHSVNTLISQVYAAVHQHTNQAVFGISPSGIWANASSNVLGSDTAGQESYYDAFADSMKWVKDRMVDYLIPQIYWHFGHEHADFSTLAHWWNDVAAGTGVQLYLGLGAYRMEEADRHPAWNSIDEINRQLALCEELDSVTGYSLYRYESCKNNPELTETLKNSAETAIAEQAQKEANDALISIKEGFHQNKLMLYTPAASVVGEPQGSLSLFAEAPRNSKVTAFYKGKACILAENNGEYMGSLSLPATPSSAPVLLVSETGGMLQVKLSACKVTVPDKVASVKGYSYADTDTSHVASITFDAPCNANALLDENTVTLTLSPCRLAPLLEDPFFGEQTADRVETLCTYHFKVPENVRNLRTEWSGNRLRLIFELQ